MALVSSLSISGLSGCMEIFGANAKCLKPACKALDADLQEVLSMSWITTFAYKT